MRRVVFTETSEAEFEAIGDHIAAHSPGRAAIFIGELRERCLELAEMPQRFAIVPQLASLGIRRRVHGNYLIFYSATEDTVEIHHVAHGSMDYERLFFPEG